jgi:hypothetical protein
VPSRPVSTLTMSVAGPHIVSIRDMPALENALSVGSILASPASLYDLYLPRPAYLTIFLINAAAGGKIRASLL